MHTPAFASARRSGSGKLLECSARYSVAHAEQLELVLPRLPVLYMSGYADDAILHHGVLEADVNFLGKPFTPDALTRAVRSVLAGSKV